MGQMKTLTINGRTFTVVSPTPVASVTLPASAWSGKSSPYSQVVHIDGITENSQVNLTPTIDQIAIFYEKDLTFVTENISGVVTVYVVGQKPENDYTILADIVEVEHAGAKIYGIPVATPFNPDNLDMDGVVRTINGVPPDETGNVTVNVPAPTYEQVSAAVNNYLALNPVDASGWTTSSKSLLIAILRNAVYSTNQSANIAALETALNSSGDPDATRYSITNDLTNVTTNNTADLIQEGNTYTATLTVADGYELDSITVAMGGVNITSEVYANGVITIPVVSGNIVIIAAASKGAVVYTITSELVNVTSTNSASSATAGTSYTATLTAADGYTLDTVTITMGGVDVTSTVYSGGVITISAVTGNVEIIASASEAVVEAVLPEDGLVGFWDFRNCDYGTSPMPATVGDGGLVRFGGTSSNDYGIIANTAFAYNPAGSGGYTTFNAPFTISSVGYADKDTPTLWNQVIMRSNMAVFAELRTVKWYNSAGTAHNLGDTAEITPTSIALKATGTQYHHLTITIDESNVLKYYYQGELVATFDPVALGLTDFSYWNYKTTYFGNYDKSKPATAVAIYDRAITETEAVELYAYTKTLEVA